MRVLHITTPQRPGGWLAEAFAADSATAIVLEEAVGSAAGLHRLRDEPFDAVLVSHEPGELDALQLIEGYRTGASEEPIIVLGHQSPQEMAALCYEVGADAYVCVSTTTTRNLIWTVARAIQFRDLARENQRLSQAERRRLQEEHDEANRLLAQQRALIGDLESLWDEGAASLAIDASSIGPTRHEQECLDLPDELVTHYRELLRTYVIMGSGNLADELNRLAELLTTAGITARETMHLHLCVLQEMIRGLGGRSARHVMNRADLLVLEIMIHLADGYRQRYRERIDPPRQQMLPGLDDALPVTNAL